MRGIVIGCLTACVLASGALAAAPTKTPPRPAIGSWKLVPIGTSSAFGSGGFTLAGKTVKDVHGKMVHFTSECATGTFSVTGSFKIAPVTFVGNVRQWTVGSGRNSSGGLAARPVTLKIAGKRQADATITIAFPGSGQKGAGEINWGVSQTSGISPCTASYYVERG